MMNEMSRKVISGDVRAASHLIRNLEDGIPGTDEVMKELYTVSNGSHVIGLTGAPGAGKSTIADQLTTSYRMRGKTVGVLAVDPTSPFTGGAILGDRIRMMGHSSDRDVFVRSMATRGSMGGLSKAAGEGIHVMEAMGKQKVIVETCGVGQQEVDIVYHAHTVVVVLVPGMGDEVQAIKAGLMEIADIFVINKADRDGAGKLYQELMNMIAMSPKKLTNDGESWTVPVIKVESTNEPHEFAGSVETLYDKIEEHYDFLTRSNLLSGRIRRKAKEELNEALWSGILQPVLNKLKDDGEMEKMISRLMLRETDPYTLAEDVAKRFMNRNEF